MPKYLPRYVTWTSITLWYSRFSWAKNWSPLYSTYVKYEGISKCEMQEVYPQRGVFPKNTTDSPKLFERRIFSNQYFLITVKHRGIFLKMKTFLIF